MNLIKNKVLPLLLLLSFAGFLNATYLTILHYQNAFPPCTLHGCEKVLSSEFATFAGIPIALFGSLYFIVLSFVIIFLLLNKNELVKKLFYLLVLSGFVISLGLIYIQAFVLNSFCQYCLLSETISTLILLLSLYHYRLTKKEK